jgi:AraC-like DNA-binding protein
MSAGQWTSASVPVGLRAVAARAMLSQVHLPWSLRLADRDSYECRLDWQGLGDCTLIECKSAPLAGYRSRPEISRTDGDYVGLLLVLSGREQVRQGECSVVLGSGDMLLWDGTRPLDFAVMSPLHKATLLIPRDRLVRAAPTTGIGGARRFDSRTGLAALVAAQVAALARLGGSIPSSDAPLAADLVVDLLGRLLDPGREQKVAGDLLERIVQHLESRLDDPDLTPSRVAASFGITPRYLHMVFARTGGTVSSYVRRRRLMRMRRDLTDPRLAHLPIIEIALRWGFNDAAHASRAFQRAYGVSPSRFRIDAR